MYSAYNLWNTVCTYTDNLATFYCKYVSGGSCDFNEKLSFNKQEAENILTVSVIAHCTSYYTQYILTQTDIFLTCTWQSCTYFMNLTCNFFEQVKVFDSDTSSDDCMGERDVDLDMQVA